MLSANEIAGFLNQLFFKLMKVLFLACRCKFMKTKSWLEIFLMGIVKNGCDLINYFLHAGKNSC